MGRTPCCSILFDLIARLVALIPPPHFHMLRYHGVLAAHARTDAIEVVRRRGDRARLCVARQYEAIEPASVGVAALAGVRGRWRPTHAEWRSLTFHVRPPTFNQATAMQHDLDDDEPDDDDDDDKLEDEEPQPDSQTVTTK